MYENGMTCKEIFEKFSHIYKSERVIQKMIKNMGISRGRYKKPIVVNEDYFECIDNEHKAYWVGFLLADGCIIRCKNKSDTLKFELNIKDKYIIEEFAKDIETDREVKDYKYDKKHNAQIQIKSNKISQDLSKYGIVSNKTFKIDCIKNIPNYFKGQPTKVNFVSPEKIMKLKQNMGHKGFVFESFKTTSGLKSQMEFKISTRSNPEFTAAIMTAYINAVINLQNSNQCGCFTPIDIPAKFLFEDSKYIEVLKTIC